MVYNILFNRRTNRGGSVTALNTAALFLKNKNIQHKIYMPKNLQETEFLAKRLSGNGDTIIVAGGDGTIFNVINNCDSTISLGILPLGTGNDIAKMLGIPTNIKDAIDIILDGEKKAVDYALINKEVLSLSFISYGIATDIVVGMGDYKSNNKLNYFLTLLKRVFKFEAKKYTAIIDGKATTYLADFFSIHNCTYAGGGMYLCHHAVIDDGLLNFMVVEYKGKIRRVLNLISILTKTLHKQPNVTAVAVEKIKVVCDKDDLCCVDGELLEIKEMEVEVVTKGIEVFVRKEVTI